VGKTDLIPAIRSPTTGTNPAIQPSSTGATGAPAPTNASGNAAVPGQPQPSDAFGGAQANLQGFEQGVAPPRSPDELTSDLSRLSSAKELAGRFGADLVLARGALLDHAALLREDKATRLFQFAVPYAQAAVGMSKSPQELKEVMADLLKQAEAAGFRDLHQQPGGKNGLAVLKDLLALKSPQEIEQHMARLKFDAPSWPKDIPRPNDARNAKAAAAAATGRAPEGFAPVTGRYAPPIDEAENSQRSQNGERRTNKVLSGRMLWNVLHLFRDDGEDGRDSAAQREAMNQLALIAALVLVFIAIVVGVLATI
jgi:hypothetical protein